MAGFISAPDEISVELAEYYQILSGPWSLEFVPALFQGIPVTFKFHDKILDSKPEIDYLSHLQNPKTAEIEVKVTSISFDGVFQIVRRGICDIRGRVLRFKGEEEFERTFFQAKYKFDTREGWMEIGAFKILEWPEDL